MRTLFILGWLLFTSLPLIGADLAREKRMADEIVDMILEGEPIELSAQNHPFMGIFTEVDDAKGSLLILHGRGFHPDWPVLVQPLRVGLAEAGWNTLSIQMPVLKKAAKYNDYVAIFPESIPRIEAALEYLKKQHPEDNIVVIAHSCGAHMAQHWIHQKTDVAQKAMDAFIGIGMGATDYKQPMVEPFALDKLSIPVLDLYGEHDYPAVLRKAPERLEMIKLAGNRHSHQHSVADAAHYFNDKNTELIQAITTWLESIETN